MRNYLTSSDRQLSVWDLFNEFDKTFNQTLERRTAPTESTMFSPTVDIEEAEDFFMLSIDLPGVKSDQVTIDVADGILKISGSRTLEKKSEGQHYRRFERQAGSFERSFRLPTNIDESKIQANFENGVLEIMVPKSELSKPRRVEIASGKGGFFSKVLGSKAQKTAETSKEDNH